MWLIWKKLLFIIGQTSYHASLSFLHECLNFTKWNKLIFTRRSFDSDISENNKMKGIHPPRISEILRRRYFERIKKVAGDAVKKCELSLKKFSVLITGTVRKNKFLQISGMLENCCIISVFRSPWASNWRRRRSIVRPWDEPGPREWQSSWGSSSPALVALSRWIGSSFPNDGPGSFPPLPNSLTLLARSA